MVDPVVLIDHGPGSWAVGVLIHEGEKRLALRANKGLDISNFGPRFSNLLKLGNGWILLPKDHMSFLRQLELAVKSY